MSGLSLNWKGACNVACGDSLLNLYLTVSRPVVGLDGSVALEVYMQEKVISFVFRSREQNVG